MELIVGEKRVALCKMQYSKARRKKQWPACCCTVVMFDMLYGPAVWWIFSDLLPTGTVSCTLYCIGRWSAFSNQFPTASLSQSTRVFSIMLKKKKNRITQQLKSLQKKHCNTGKSPKYRLKTTNYKRKRNVSLVDVINPLTAHLLQSTRCVLCTCMHWYLVVCAGTMDVCVYQSLRCLFFFPGLNLRKIPDLIPTPYQHVTKHHRFLCQLCRRETPTSYT